MKQVVVVVIALMVASLGAQAAQIDTKAGTKAIMFGFEGLSNLKLDSYGTGIGARYYLSDGMAIRPGVVFNINNTTTKGTGGFSDDKQDNFGLGVNVALEKHMATSTSISPYMGAGVGWLYNSAAHTLSVNNPGTGDELKATTTTNNINIFLVGGFEWGFTESLTLGGEYQAGVGIGSGKTKTDYQDSPTITSGDVSMLRAGVNATGVVYLSVTL